MKVETPQILWNSEGDKGKNAPLYSIAMLESGVSDGLSADNYGHILVTAGNTNVINLWKVCFNKEESATGGMFHKSHHCGDQKVHKLFEKSVIKLRKKASFT